LIDARSITPGPLQLGQDYKFYVASGVTMLKVIHSPKQPGLVCNFIFKSLDIASCKDNTSLPSFLAGFKYEKTGLHFVEKLLSEI
jgi:hypothetical protein